MRLVGRSPTRRVLEGPSAAISTTSSPPPVLSPTSRPATPSVSIETVSSVEPRSSARLANGGEVASPIEPTKFNCAELTPPGCKGVRITICNVPSSRPALDDVGGVITCQYTLIVSPVTDIGGGGAAITFKSKPPG